MRTDTLDVRKLYRDDDGDLWAHLPRWAEHVQQEWTSREGWYFLRPNGTWVWWDPKNAVQTKHMEPIEFGALGVEVAARRLRYIGGREIPWWDVQSVVTDSPLFCTHLDFP